MIDPKTAVDMIMIGKEAKEILEKVYTYFKKTRYGNVGIFLSVKIVFSEAMKFDDWLTKINSVLSLKGMRKDISEEKVVGDALRILNITGDLVGLPQITDFDGDLIEIEGSMEDDSEPVFYVKSGVIEAKPYCSERTCLSKAVDVLVNIISEFEGQFLKARVFIELRFSSADKAFRFYERIRDVFEKDYGASVKERKIIVYPPTPGNVVQIVISPYIARAVDAIEKELFQRKVTCFFK